MIYRVIAIATRMPISGFERVMDLFKLDNHTIYY